MKILILSTMRQSDANMFKPDGPFGTFQMPLEVGIKIHHHANLIFISYSTADEKLGVIISHGHDDHLDDWFIKQTSKQ